MKNSKPLALLLLFNLNLTACIPPGKDINPDEPIRSPFGKRNESSVQEPGFSPNDRETLFTLPEFISLETKLATLGCRVDTAQGVNACPQNASLEEASELLVTLRAFRAARMEDRELLKNEKLSYLVSRTSTTQIEAIEGSAAIIEVRREMYRLRSESRLASNVTGDMDVDLSYVNRLQASNLVKILSEDNRFNELLGELDIGLVIMSDVTRMDRPEGRRQLKIKFDDQIETVIAYLNEQGKIHGAARTAGNASDRLRHEIRLSHNLYMAQLSEDSKVRGLELLARLSSNPRFAELLYLNSLDYIVLSSQSRVEKNLNFQFLRIDFNAKADEIMQTLEAAATAN